MRFMTNRLTELLLYLELVMQRLDVVFDALDELRLVFTDGSADVRPHEQRVEAGEDAEHLVGILCSSKLVSETSSDTCLHSVYSLIIPLRRKTSDNEWF